MLEDSKAEKFLSSIREMDNEVLRMIYRSHRLKEAVEKERAKKLISKK